MVSVLFHLCNIKSLKSFFVTHHEILSDGKNFPIIRKLSLAPEGLV